MSPANHGYATTTPKEKLARIWRKDTLTKNWREKLLKRAQDREFSFFNPPPPDKCPNKDKHRGPEGPNEDIMSCLCGTVTYSKRPWGETFGHHLPDCSLPIWHESYCQPGGDGHPPAETIRG